jgi:hypothetical protein
VRAEINFLGTQFAVIREQLLTVLHGGVIRFVTAEKSPDRTEGTDGTGCVYANRDWKGIGLGEYKWSGSEAE